MEMILIPAGLFLMGEGEDTHQVKLAEFNMAKYPVTNLLYRTFVTAAGYRPPPHWESSYLLHLLDDHPVVNVSWADANAYCRWLTQETGQPRVFAEMLAKMLWWCGEDKIIYGGETPIFHPQWALKAFWDLELPQDLTTEFGYPPLTEQAKRKILGENLARLHGIDVAAKKKELGIAH